MPRALPAMMISHSTKVEVRDEVCKGLLEDLMFKELLDLFGYLTKRSEEGGSTVGS